MKIRNLLTTIAFASLALVGGCSAAAESDAQDEVVGVGQDEISNVDLAKALVGEFVDDSGTFKSLAFAVTNGRKTFSTKLDTGIRCIRTPCPSSAEFSGTFSVSQSRGTTSLTLTAPNAPTQARRFLGKYTYVLNGSKLSLSRAGFQQSLGRVTCEDRATADSCAADTTCRTISKPYPCAPGMMCPAVMVFDRCVSTCEGRTEETCTAEDRCAPSYKPFPCAPGRMCPAVMVFDKCSNAE